MATEILHHPDIGDPGREWPLAAGVDLENFAEIAVCETLAQANERRVEPLYVSDCTDEFVLFESINQELARLERVRNRFLDERVYACCCEVLSPTSW